MNGASADPSVYTIKVDSNNRKNIIGNNQNFFLFFIKCHRSNINSIIRKAFLYILDHNYNLLLYISYMYLNLF